MPEMFSRKRNRRHVSLQRFIQQFTRHHTSNHIHLKSGQTAWILFHPRIPRPTIVLFHVEQIVITPSGDSMSADDVAIIRRIIVVSIHVRFYHLVDREATKW